MQKFEVEKPREILITGANYSRRISLNLSD